MHYVADTWIVSATWPPETWCVYGQPVKTNNDVEGWHHRLNRKAQQSGLNMYLLFALLGHEASMVTVNMKLMSDNKVRMGRVVKTALAQMPGFSSTGPSTRLIVGPFPVC